MVLMGKLFEASDQKITENSFSTLQKKNEGKDSKSNNITIPLQTERIKLNKTWKKKHSDQNCWNFAKLELRSQVLTFSTLM